MSFMLARINVDDYDAWKPMFDSDPAGARKAAKGHRILRAADDPNEVFIQVEFDSADDARAARQALIDHGVLERVNVLAGPTVAETADEAVYTTA